MVKLEPKSTFAGFTWPRYVAHMACGKAALLEKRELRLHCDEYYHYGIPITKGNGFSFYLNSDFQPFKRWQWADDVNTRIKHRGWYTSNIHTEDTIRGIVAYLSHGRMVPGWAMGVGMAAYVAAESYTDAEDCAAAADELARIVAEHERDREEEEEEEEEEEG